MANPNKTLKHENKSMERALIIIKYHCYTEERWKRLRELLKKLIVKARKPGND